MSTCPRCNKVSHAPYFCLAEDRLEVVEAKLARIRQIIDLIDEYEENSTFAAVKDIRALVNEGTSNE